MSSAPPFKRGDVLEFHCRNQKRWEHANGSILIVTQDQHGNNFSGRWVSIPEPRRENAESYDYFDAYYFTKITEIDREDTDATE